MGNERRIARELLGLARSLAAGFSLTESMRKMELAQDTRTPRSILADLAQDYNNYVRLAVANNSSTPREVIELLCGDSVYDVKMAAKRALPFAPDWR